MSVVRRRSAVGVLCHPLFVRSFVPARHRLSGVKNAAWKKFACLVLVIELGRERRMRGLLRLLLLPAGILGVAVENEICPTDRAETKICSARQDFVVVVDRSYSRRPYFEEFKSFLKGFFDYIGLDGGTNSGPRVSLVSFAGRIIEPDSEWNNAEGHALDTTFTDPSGSRAAVLAAVDNLPYPEQTCTETGGCTCISCGAEVAWARIPEAARAGAATPAPLCPSPRPRRASPCTLRAPSLQPLQGAEASRRRSFS